MALRSLGKDLTLIFENKLKTRVKGFFEFIEELKRESLIKSELPEMIIREYFDDMCADVVKLSLEEVLEEKSNYLSLTQGNILSGLLNEHKRKLITKVRILDGANISIFIVHFFANFNDSRLQTAKLLCAVSAEHNIYKQIYEQHFYETVEQLLFAFNEENISKISFEEFIIFDRYLTKFLSSLPESTSLAEKWYIRSSKYYMRHSLNLYLDILKSVNIQSIESSHVEHKLQHPIPARSLDIPSELVQQFTSLTDSLNKMLVDSVMSEVFHRFIERFHKVASFLIHLRYSRQEIVAVMDAKSDLRLLNLDSVIKSVSTILNSMLFAYLKISFDLNSQQHQVTVITESLSDAQKLNIWDRNGLFSFCRNRIKYNSIVAISVWFDETLGSKEFDSEMVNYLKQIRKVKVNRTAHKLENRFSQFEYAIMAHMDMQRVRDLLAVVRPLNLLSDSAHRIVADAVSSIQLTLARSLANEKLPIESFVMCLVNRKFEDGKKKEYVKLLAKYIKDLDFRLKHVLKGCVDKPDAEEFLSFSKVSLLNFVLEVYQDMLTKTAFSNENFERSKEDYAAIKKELLCDPSLTEGPDTGIARLLEIKDSLGDKSRTIKLLSDNTNHFSTLFSRKLFDKYLKESDESLLKDSLLQLLKP